MFLTRWLAAFGDRSKPVARPAFKPGFETLGDRVVPHGGLGGGVGELAAPWSLIGFSSSDEAVVEDDTNATQFAVLSRSDAYAGAAAKVAVVALDENGRPDRDYTGTVTLSSTDPAAVLPESYTFTEEDHGRHTFTVTLSTLGPATLTASDADGAITGTAAVTVQAAPVADELFVRAERSVYAGGATRVVVAALDESNRVVRDYTGTVTLTSSDAGATLPESYTFTAEDRGVHVFEVTPAAVGDLTVTATDGESLTGAVTVDVQEAPTVASIVVIARPVAERGATVQFFVVALDANNRAVPTFTGTVTVTSSDPSATLPESYTFTAADRGVKAFTATLGTEGEQTITVTGDGETPLTAGVAVTVVADGTFGGGFGFGRPNRGFR